MEIDLTGQIVLLDEAHNIEDCARESSSFNLDHSSLLACRDELDGMVNINIRRSQHEPLRNFCYSLIKLESSFCLCLLLYFDKTFSEYVFCPCCSWIQESQGLMSERGYETSSKVWNGKDVLGIFHNLGITADTFGLLKVHQNIFALSVVGMSWGPKLNNWKSRFMTSIISSCLSFSTTLHCYYSIQFKCSH